MLQLQKEKADLQEKISSKVQEKMLGDDIHVSPEIERRDPVAFTRTCYFQLKETLEVNDKLRAEMSALRRSIADSAKSELTRDSHVYKVASSVCFVVVE